MRSIAWVLAMLAIALGGVHLSFTPSNYPTPTVGMLWFIGTGVAIVFSGLINVLALRASPSDAVARWLAVAVNGACAAGFGLSWQVMQGPQVIVGAVLFGLLALLALTRR